MKNKIILLPEKRFKKATPEELRLSVELTEEKNLLNNDDRDIILDLNKLFDKERNDSITYKIFGKIKMVFRNVYTGSTSYDYLSERLYINGDGSSTSSFDGTLPYNEFAFLRNDIYRQIHDMYSGSSLSDFDGYVLKETGSKEHQTVTEVNSPKHNWNIYLTYAYDKDKSYPMTYTLIDSSLNFVSGDGIPFEVIDMDTSYKLVSPVEHGIKEGEYIVINNNIFYVNSVGDEKYNSEKFVLNINKSQISNEQIDIFNTLSLIGKRCLDNKSPETTTSEYYVHKNKTLTEVDDYIMDKVGFEESIWENEKKILFYNSKGTPNVLVEKNRMESILYDFKEPFILSGITNNLGYLPTDLYVTVIFRNGNGYFYYPLKLGYYFNFHDTWIDKRFEDINSIETGLSGTTFIKDDITFISGDTLPIGTVLIGNFIEYSPTEMKERIISNTFHKLTNPEEIFNYGQTDNEKYIGASETNPFGLFYQTHYKVKLRELSPYVETSDTPEVDNLPQNATYFEKDKMWKWRDLYDHGYIDASGFGVDHPFINGMHYVKTDINFYLRNEQLHKVKVDGINDFNNKKINC